MRHTPGGRERRAEHGQLDAEANCRIRRRGPAATPCRLPPPGDRWRQWNVEVHARNATLGHANPPRHRFDPLVPADHRVLSGGNAVET